MDRPDAWIEAPCEVTVAAWEARSRTAAGMTVAATRTRARAKNGVWLLIHASCLHQADRIAAHTAVVIEPAKASEVAPLIMDAYELTPREVDVTRPLARGLTAVGDAASLEASDPPARARADDERDRPRASPLALHRPGPPQVRVREGRRSSRSELVAKMFADRYHDGLEHAIQRAAPALAAAA